MVFSVPSAIMMLAPAAEVSTLPGGRVSIGGAALVDAVEHHSGCHSTGDVNTVKDQGNDSLWVRFRAFPKSTAICPAESSPLRT